VDGRNGYRGYDESQLFTARLIVSLRGLDMPLHEVARVVSADSTGAAELIDSYWASQERRFVAQRQIAAALRPGVAASDLPSAQLPVHERWVPEQPVLTEQRHVYLGQLIWTQEATARLVAQADRCGGVAGRPFVIFHGLVAADSDALGPSHALRSYQLVAEAMGLAGRSWRYPVVTGHGLPERAASPSRMTARQRSA
jgi:DNA-binding transcriptional MerR regulator